MRNRELVCMCVHRGICISVQGVLECECARVCACVSMGAWCVVEKHVLKLH